MKKGIRNFIAIAVFVFMSQTTMRGQIDAGLLVNIHNVTDTEMNAIVSPITGSLVYSTTQNSIMQYNGTTWDKLLEGSAATNVEVLPKTTSYTVVNDDNGKVLTFDSVTDVTLTIPASLPIGFNISIYQIGVGKVTISGSGVTIKNRLSRYKTAGKDAGVGLISTATNIFHLTGDLKL